MREWLPAAAVLPLFVAVTAAHAQNKTLAPADVASVARTRILDLRVSEQQAPARPMSLMRGMILQQGVASNAFLGVGLANIYRKQGGSDLRLGDRPQHTRKPAVTFVMKF